MSSGREAGNPSSAAPSGSASGAANAAGKRPAGRPRPVIRGLGGGNTILVHPSQRKNPILRSIKGVGWEMADIVPDFQVGLTTCILYLSLMYHRAKPYYIHERVSKLGSMFTLRVLLVMNDVHDSMTDIRDLSKVALVNNLTIVMAWSEDEAASYIETYKLFEHKSPDPIRERTQSDYQGQVNTMLTSVRGVNKTDVLTLTSNLGSIDSIARASSDQLSYLPGFGPTKVKRLREAFNQPFRVGETRTMRQRKEHDALAAAERGEAMTDDWDARHRLESLPSSSVLPPPPPPAASARAGSSSDLLPPPAPRQPSQQAMPPPLLPSDDRTEATPQPQNPALRAALAFRKGSGQAPEGGQAPKMIVPGGSNWGAAPPAPPVDEPRGTKRAHEDDGSSEPATATKPPEVPATVDETGGLDLELRDLEDLDDEAQLALALKMSGSTPSATRTDQAAASVTANLQPAAPPSTEQPPPTTAPASKSESTDQAGGTTAEFAPEADLNLDLDDLDDLTEEEQLAIAMQMSQQGL